MAPSKPVCPRLVQYPAATQEQMAAELDALPPDATLRPAMGDYGRLRAELRAACR